MLKRIPSLAGMTPWVLTDFHSPRRTLPGKQDFYNRKELISDRGERKQAFHVLQEFYRRMAAMAQAQSALPGASPSAFTSDRRSQVTRFSARSEPPFCLLAKATNGLLHRWAAVRMGMRKCGDLAPSLLIGESTRTVDTGANSE
jgi:hypothetical protein